MLHLGSTYLIVKDMDRSVDFYTKLLDMQPTARAYDRWAQFNFDNQCIALYNNEFDGRKIAANDHLEQHYNEAYLEYYNGRTIEYGNNVTLNFWIEDLKLEYDRIGLLEIGKLSKIMYVNISSPYYFFHVSDPDGNVIEITGGYTE